MIVIKKCPCFRKVHASWQVGWKISSIWLTILYQHRPKNEIVQKLSVKMMSL